MGRGEHLGDLEALVLAGVDRNVGTLILARTAARSAEITIRTASKPELPCSAVC